MCLYRSDVGCYDKRFMPEAMVKPTQKPRTIVQQQQKWKAERISRRAIPCETDEIGLYVNWFRGHPADEIAYC